MSNVVWMSQEKLYSLHFEVFFFIYITCFKALDWNIELRYIYVFDMTLKKKEDFIHKCFMIQFWSVFAAVLYCISDEFGFKYRVKLR